MSYRPAWANRVLLAVAVAFATATMAPAAMAQTIRMWTFLNPAGKSGREKVLKQLIDGFEAANPGVKVAVELQDYRTLGTKFFAANQTGTAPDIIWLNIPRIYGAIKQGALANLDDLFVKNWSKADIDDVDGASWRLGASEHAHYQIMLTRGMYGQFYRTDLFKEAGIDPKSLSSWDKFIAAAEKLTVKDASGKVTRWGYGATLTGADPIPPIIFSVISEQQGDIFDKNGKANWATPAGVKGLQLEQDLMQKYKVMPEAALHTIEDDGTDEFSAGQMAIFRGGTSRLPQAMTALGEGKVGYLPTPSFTEGKYSPSGCSGWSVGVWSGSKVKDLAGKLVEYMANRDASWLWTEKAGMIPIRKSTIAEHPDYFRDPKNSWLVDVASDLATRCSLPPDGADGYYEQLNSALQDVMVNHLEPMAALEKAQQAYNRTRR